MAKIIIEVDTRSGQANIRDLEDEIEDLDDQVDETAGTIRSFGDTAGSVLKKLAIAAAGAFAIAKLIEYGKELVKIADTYTLIDSKIKLGTDSQEEFNQAYEELFRISRDTNSQLEINAQTFNKLALSMDIPLDELLRSQEILNQSMIVSGATTAESAGFMLQYAQAMGSGVVAGDELKSMNEANSFLMSKIAEQLGTNIAGLKEMGSAGTLTSEKFFKALLKVGDEVEEQYGQIPVTVERALNDLNQVYKRIIGDSNKAIDGTKGIAQSITDLADIIDQNRDAIVTLFVGIVDGAGQAIDHLGRFVNEFIAFQDVLHGVVSFGDFLSLTQEETRRYGEIRDELATIKSLQDQIDAGTGIIDSLLGKGLDPTDLKDLEDYIQTMKDRIDDVLSGDGEKKVIPLEVDTTKTKSALEQVNAAFHKSAEQWMKTTGKNGEKIIKKYQEDIEKASKDIIETTRDLAEELADLTREGMSDPEVWKSVNDQIKEYQKNAVAAAEAGDWEGQLDFLSRAKSLISELDSDGVQIKISESDVAKAKQIAIAAKEASQAQSTSGTRQAAKEALAEYKKLVAQKKAGGKTEISQQEAINKKKELTKTITESIIAAQQENLDNLKDEADSFQKTFETYKAELEQVGESTAEVIAETEKVGVAWVEVGGEWHDVSGGMVSDIDTINDSVLELINNMNNVKLPTGGFDGARAAGGPVSAGRKYLVGERGPEMFTPTAPGFIIPNSDNGQSNRDIVDINFQLPLTQKVAQFSGPKQSIDDLQKEIQEWDRYRS